jgi:hypothetical protein
MQDAKGLCGASGEMSEGAAHARDDVLSWGRLSPPSCDEPNDGRVAVLLVAVAKEEVPAMVDTMPTYYFIRMKPLAKDVPNYTKVQRVPKGSRVLYAQDRTSTEGFFGIH